MSVAAGYRRASAIRVPVIVATSFPSARSLNANARASHTVSVRPGLTTSARNRKCSPSRGRNQVRLELDREHGEIRRHQRERGIAARAVERSCNDASVHEAVLLREGEAIRHRKLDPAGPDSAKSRFPMFASPVAARSWRERVGRTRHPWVRTPSKYPVGSPCYDLETPAWIAPLWSDTGQMYGAGMGSFVSRFRACLNSSSNSMGAF